MPDQQPAGAYRDSSKPSNHGSHDLSWIKNFFVDQIVKIRVLIQARDFGAGPAASACRSRGRRRVDFGLSFMMFEPACIHKCMHASINACMHRVHL